MSCIRHSTYDDAQQQLSAVTGDPQRGARVNAALDWYHGNVRLHAAGLTWHRVIGKNMKQPVSEGQAKAHAAGLQTTLQVQSGGHCITNCTTDHCCLMMYAM